MTEYEKLRLEAIKQIAISKALLIDIKKSQNNICIGLDIKYVFYGMLLAYLIVFIITALLFGLIILFRG